MAEKTPETPRKTKTTGPPGWAEMTKIYAEYPEGEWYLVGNTVREAVSTILSDGVDPRVISNWSVVGGSVNKAYDLRQQVERELVDRFGSDVAQQVAYQVLRGTP